MKHDLTVGQLQELLENFKRIEAEQGSFDAVHKTALLAFNMGIAAGEETQCEK